MHSSPSSAARLVAAGSLVVLVVVAAALLLWLAGSVWMLLFAGILFAVFLDGLTAALLRFAPIPRGWALASVCLVLLALTGLTAWLCGSRIVEQASLVAAEVPKQIEVLQAGLAADPTGRWVIAQSAAAEEALPEPSEVVPRVLGILSTTAGALGALAFILFVGLYLVVDPKLYREGILHLFPSRKRPRAREICDAVRHALAWWLAGRGMDMTLVGVLTLIGLLILGVPAALTLALLAALLSFVPNIGPILSAVPAILIGLMQSPMTAVWVIALYVTVQAVESYLVTPMIQQRVVSIPPALVITVQVIFGLLGGMLGLFLATPITVAAVILIQTLYIQDVLHDDVKLLGEG